MKMTAHKFQSNHYFDVAVIGRHEWECMGYTRTGRKIRFARVVEVEGNLRQINKYLDPDAIVDTLFERLYEEDGR